jgi:16S rRNA (uracil1498-N3)-methyltransferase
MKHSPRLYVEGPLSPELEVKPDAIQMHHLVNVLRLKVGDAARVFNEKYGEWNCVLISKCLLKCETLFKEAGAISGPTVAFCLINPNRMSVLLEKITELGVSAIVPIISQHTQYRKFNVYKARQIIIGACEQSGRISVPQLSSPIRLEQFLLEYDYNCPLIVGDETLSGEPLTALLVSSCAFLVGPEGGFSNFERSLLDHYPFVKKATLGHNILRSETAAIAFMSAWAVMNDRFSFQSLDSEASKKLHL